MNDLSFEEYIRKKQDISFINKRRKLEHVGRNIYVYDLTPITFLRFKNLTHSNLYEVFNIKDYNKVTRDSIESIIMERTLDIVLSQKSLDYYLNNINVYIEMITDYIHEDVWVWVNIDYEDKQVIDTITNYILLFSKIINIILAGSIDINYNMKDLNEKDNIDWENSFYVLDYITNIANMNFRLEIARYYYYEKDKQ